MNGLTNVQVNSHSQKVNIVPKRNPRTLHLILWMYILLCICMLCLLMYLQNKYDSPMLNSNKNNIAKQQFTNSWPNLYSQNLICKSTKIFCEFSWIFTEYSSQMLNSQKEVYIFANINS